jgi:hypothetical protein
MHEGHQPEFPSPSGSKDKQTAMDERRARLLDATKREPLGLWRVKGRHHQKYWQQHGMLGGAPFSSTPAAHHTQTLFIKASA